jgi:hypothetical protein
VNVIGVIGLFWVNTNGDGVTVLNTHVSFRKVYGRELLDDAPLIVVTVIVIDPDEPGE